MATIGQIQDLNHFIEMLPAAEREALSIDEIYERWRDQAFRHDDLLAIKASLRDFENGERGRPIEEFLAEFKADRNARNPGQNK